LVVTPYKSARSLSSPGLEGIQKTTNVDVAKAIIEHIEREVKPAGRNRARKSRRLRQ
jgi:hypothetical protein